LPDRSTATAPAPAAQPAVAAGAKKTPSKKDQSGGFELVPTDERWCPGCRAKLAPDDVFCVACGLDLKTGKKAQRVFEPLQRSWETGPSFRRRMTIFVGPFVLIVPLATLGAIMERQILPFFIPLVFFSILLAFLMGTYERIDLARNERGRVSLSKTWRVCFFARQPEKIVPLRYHGIRTTSTYGVSMADIAMTIFLGVLGLVPGIIWLFWSLRKITYEVALTGEDGHTEVRLYTGSSEKQMQEISETLHGVTGLPRKVG
jgi:hypothetical protein